MLELLQKENREKLHTLIALMLPILGTQLANMGMGFFDASMSGQAGNVDLAGAAIGSNLWAPLHTGFGGILMAGTALTANALGAGDKPKILQILVHGLFLALVFGLFIIVGGIFALPLVLAQMGIEPQVFEIAYYYLTGVAIGIIPMFLTVPLRNLIDTLGHTDLTMKLYLVGLPINAFLNYVLIFGKCGLPRLGGIGAGVATGLTYWLLFLLFVFVVCRVNGFKQYVDLSNNKAMAINCQQIKEYLRIGVPMGFSIFLEVAIFCVVAFFMAKFGTDTIAAHQAAMNMSCLIYMIPMSFSMALTIVVGIEYGAKRLDGAFLYSKLGIQLSIATAFVYLVIEYFGRGPMSYIYSSDAHVRELLQQFITFAVIWQCGDAVAAPIQGILRGYKDVDATFWSNVLAYWGICMPVGLLLDYKFAMGPFAYWESLALGVICSAVIMVWRLNWLQKRLVKSVIEH